MLCVLHLCVGKNTLVLQSANTVLLKFCQHRAVSESAGAVDFVDAVGTFRCMILIVHIVLASCCLPHTQGHKSSLPFICRSAVHSLLLPAWGH
jgi:hypothetical protein